MASMRYRIQLGDGSLIARYDGVVNLDTYDTAIRDGIIALAIKDEGPPSPGLVENKLGLADTLTGMFYIIQYVFELVLDH